MLDYVPYCTARVNSDDSQLEAAIQRAAREIVDHDWELQSLRDPTRPADYNPRHEA